ncbi:hypothetical protein DFA_09041 [Cavenderia fasciculata]|uniref:Histone H2A n=1 Tax=Cavenderia fasciculata TaxID=261658 RepID=F4Q6J3_CACFS|nr:uncharacterized protein DFA_09041 [Cavenderia fasciculata]EGG16503.1 hypothetical protein DFA_09041 [Cavenderia fasciculata]|eukprot:XP_004354903.1 hypothetical protein DFA_09041 [Cavenderia fasciculata]
MQKVLENIVSSLQQPSSCSALYLVPITLSQASIQYIQSIIFAHELTIKKKRKVPSTRDFQIGARIVLSGQIAKDAIVHAMESIIKPEILLFQPSWSIQDIKESMLFYRVPKDCGIYLAAMLESIVTHILELSLTVVQQQQQQGTILEPEHIKLGISKDNELESLFNGFDEIGSFSKLSSLQNDDNYNDNEICHTPE